MNVAVKLMVAGALGIAPVGVLAQNAGYPVKPVRWVVPFTPGASNDIIARLIAAKLGDAWGQQFIIDNRAGAGGLVGADTVAKAAPDGDPATRAGVVVALHKFAPVAVAPVPPPLVIVTAGGDV